MQNISQTSKTNFIDINVTEKIDNRNLKKFINTSLSLNNKNYSTKSKIFLSYIEELKNYQIFILEKDFKYFDFQVFELFYETKNGQNNYDLFICDDFICIYKNAHFYYFQNIDFVIKTDEFVEFINKKFLIQISNIKKFEKNDYEELKLKYLETKNKNLLKFMSLKNSYNFEIYLTYLFFIFIIFLNYFLVIDEFKQDESNIFVNRNFLETIKKDFEFKKLDIKIENIISNIHQNGLFLDSFEFKENNMKFIINSSSKHTIYQFLNQNNKIILDSSINYVKDKNIYLATIYVRIF